MEQETVVESNDVLLNDLTIDSPADIQLAQSMANSRIVSQNTVYLVEDVEVETVAHIEAFYHSNKNRKNSFTTNKNGKLYSLLENKEIDKSEITVGLLTRQHMGKQQLTGRPKDLCVPIEPVEYREGNTEHTAYFAEVSTQNVATITLRGDDGERQTVYKIVPNQDVDTVTNYVGSTVEFGSTDESVIIKGTSTNIPDSFVSETSSRERAQELIDTLWGTHSSILLSIGGLWTTSLLLNQINLISTILVRFFSLILLIAVMLVILSSMSEENNTIEQTSDTSNSTNSKTTSGSITDGDTEEIALDKPAILTPQYDVVSPVTKLNVLQSFDEGSLTLTVEGPEEIVEWTYETNDDGVFLDTKIIEFYTELGFNILERQNFDAYISTEKYQDESPYLVTTNSQRMNVYMYPTDPTTT